MFRRSDIDAVDLDSVVRSWRHRLRYVQLNQFAFEVPNSEESIYLTRAKKQPSESGVEFWVASQRLEDWSYREHAFMPYLRGAAFE